MECMHFVCVGSNKSLHICLVGRLVIMLHVACMLQHAQHDFVLCIQHSNPEHFEQLLSIPSMHSSCKRVHFMLEVGLQCS